MNRELSDDQIYILGYHAGRSELLAELCNIVNDCKYPEYLEEAICDYLEEHGKKVKEDN